jgi:predicted nucleotidyltransferase
VLEDLIARLRPVLQAGPKLRFAILFGSHARGTARPDSDVDIAIASVDELTPRQEASLAAALERAAGIEHDTDRELQLDAMRRFRARVAAGG